jgi:hypothetical protein
MGSWCANPSIGAISGLGRVERLASCGGPWARSSDELASMPASRCVPLPGLPRSPRVTSPKSNAGLPSPAWRSLPLSPACSAPMSASGCFLARGRGFATASRHRWWRRSCERRIHRGSDSSRCPSGGRSGGSSTLSSVGPATQSSPSKSTPSSAASSNRSVGLARRLTRSRRRRPGRCCSRVRHSAGIADGRSAIDPSQSRPRERLRVDHSRGVSRQGRRRRPSAPRRCRTVARTSADMGRDHSRRSQNPRPPAAFGIGRPLMGPAVRTAPLFGNAGQFR